MIWEDTMIPVTCRGCKHKFHVHPASNALAPDADLCNGCRMAKQTLAQLEPKPEPNTWQRDYGQRKPRKDWSDYVIWVSTVGIIAVCLVLCWQEWF